LWTSVFALGAFIGPTMAGILFDAIGFPMATLFIIITQAIVFFALIGFAVTYQIQDRTAASTAAAAAAAASSATAERVKDEDEAIEDPNSPLLDPNSDGGGYGAVGGAAEEQRRRRSRYQ
jgi:predicted lipid-binding transport protein (Tim44 family)